MLVMVIILFLILAGCALQQKCSANIQCLSPGQTGSCVQGACQYTPLAAQSCESDSQCTKQGYAGNCIKGQCAWNPISAQVFQSKSQLNYFTDSVNSAGNVFNIAATFAAPFNILQDRMRIKIELAQQQHKNILITRLEFEGDDKSTKQRVLLGSKTLKKPVWQPGDSISEELAFDFPTTVSSGEFENLLLKVMYTGLIDSRLQTNTYSASLRNFVLNWQARQPKACPQSCDDQNPATADVCSIETQYACVHNSLAGVCGNGVCDSLENVCSCATDCGPCQTGGEKYVEKVCEQNSCVGRLRQGVAKKPFTLLDERSMSALKFSTRISYVEPYDIRSDKIIVDVSLFDKQPEVNSVRITGVQLLEGQNLIAEKTGKQILAGIGSHAIAELTIPAQSVAEAEHWLSIVVNYEYARQNTAQPVKERFERQLGKLTLLSP